MLFKSALIVILFVIQYVSSDDYGGQDFPTKYLDVDNVTPTMDDFKYYLDSLQRSVYYVTENPNSTDVNQALGIFFAKSVLKKALQDYSHKMQKEQLDPILLLIDMLEYVSSHYIYKNFEFGWSDIEFRVSRLFVDDTPQVYSIGDLTRNRMKKWLFSSADNLNEFLQDMDKAVLPREKYALLVESRTSYFIRIPDSDVCVSRVVNNHEPIGLRELRPCRPDAYCRKAIRSSPSVAYTLSHRLLNIMMYRHLRRCYMETEASDDELMEMLCANMYREAVYLARRGFFARDLFLEHISLCGMLGYEEFFRRQWFTKAASWVNEEGCVQENLNFEINRTTIMIDKAINDKKRVKKIRKIRTTILNNECHTHPMALTLIVLAHGVRHALHYMKELVALE